MEQRDQRCEPQHDPHRRNSSRDQRRYFIHDYTGASIKETVNVDFADWQRETLALAKGSSIVEWRTFRTPLKTLGRLGKYVMLLSSISPFYLFASLIFGLASFILGLLAFFHSISSSTVLTIYLVSLIVAFICSQCYHAIDHTLRLEHSFLTFTLTNNHDKSRAVSIEKIRDGILFQIAHTPETVEEFARGEERGHVEELSASKNVGFDILSSLPTSMELILASEELFGAFYDVFFDNCQQAVSKLLTGIAEKSLGLEFCIPGSDAKVKIDNNEVVTFVETLFPKWHHESAQLFPHILDPFAIIVKELSAEKTVDHAGYRFLVFKQKIVDALYRVLTEGKYDYLKGRKALFSKLCQTSFRSSILKAGRFSGSMIIETISNMWSKTLDILAVLDGLGVVIFHFSDETRDEDSQDTIAIVKKKMDLASKIENVSKEGQKRIHAVIITRCTGKAGFSSVKESSHGYWMSLEVPPQVTEADLDDLMKSCLKRLAAASTRGRENIISSICKAFRRIRSDATLICNYFCNESLFSRSLRNVHAPFHRFTSKLFLLQNMENKDALVHERLVKQEYGSREFIIWTPKQSEIIQEARQWFHRQDQATIRWIIQGCYGSGKTLLLVQLVKEFIESEKEGNIFIYVNASNERLLKMLREHISEKRWESRVIVGHQPVDVSKFQLVLWDEFYFFRRGMISFQKELFLQFSYQNPSIVLFTSESMKRVHDYLKAYYFKSIEWMSDMDFRVRPLDGNLRSSGEITKFVAKFQEYLNQDDWAVGEPVRSSLNWKSDPPQIELFHDDSNDRLPFLQECLRVITDLAKREIMVMVSPFLRLSQRASLQDLCKDIPNVSFGFSKEIIGCQYQCVVVIMDAFACFPPTKYLVDSMTRATTCLQFIANVSVEPVFIDGIPSTRLELCLKRDVESRVRRLISDVDSHLGKKVLINDNNLLQKSFIEEITDKVVVLDMFSMKTWANLGEATKEYSLFVDIRQSLPQKGPLEGNLAFFSFPPFIQLMLTDEEQELPRAAERYSLNRLRNRDTDFFKSYFERMTSSDQRRSLF